MPFSIDGPVPLPDAKTEPSLDGLIAWLETQEPGREYDGTKVNECLLAQWLRTYGLKHQHSPSTTFVYGHLNLEDTVFPQIAVPIFKNRDEKRKDFTFGAALERAKAVRARLVHEGAV